MNEYELIDILRNEDSTIKVDLLDDDKKKQILLYEMKRASEPVPFINKGMEEAFEYDEAVVVITDNRSDKPVRHTEDNNTFTLRTEDGSIIGELIYDEEELEELHNDPTVYFLSENFVTYNNAFMSGQKQFFVMEAEKSSFITDKDLDSTVEKLVVAVPSTETDHYIKDCYGMSHDDAIGTVIIGFNPLRDE
ncbi:MAG: hypothetical protein LUG89_01675 [Methanosphaera sp.]|nr:hypothetical protein [Methanosphaera sp.]